MAGELFSSINYRMQVERKNRFSANMKVEEILFERLLESDSYRMQEERKESVSQNNEKIHFRQR